MLPESRSLNLSNAGAVLVFEAWRQLEFVGAGLPGAGDSESSPTGEGQPTDPSAAPRADQE